MKHGTFFFGIWVSTKVQCDGCAVPEAVEGFVVGMEEHQSRF